MTVKGAIAHEQRDFAERIKPLTAARMKPGVLVLTYYVDSRTPAGTMRQHRLAAFDARGCRTSIILQTEWLR